MLEAQCNQELWVLTSTVCKLRVFLKKNLAVDNISIFLFYPSILDRDRESYGRSGLGCFLEEVRGCWCRLPRVEGHRDALPNIGRSTPDSTCRRSLDSRSTYRRSSVVLSICVAIALRQLRVAWPCWRIAWGCMMSAPVLVLCPLLSFHLQLFLGSPFFFLI